MRQKIQVKRGYQVQYADPITVKAGESLTLGRMDAESPGWRWCKAADGRQGWVPVEFLSGEGPRIAYSKPRQRGNRSLATLESSIGVPKQAPP